MFTHRIRIIDKSDPPQKALVAVYIGLHGLTTWRSRSPGAFRVQTTEEHPARDFATHTGDDVTVFLAVYTDGSFNCFQLNDFFMGLSVFTHDSGEGWIYEKGAAALKPGAMTWEKF